jgi:ArsR family transcriptional regulator
MSIIKYTHKEGEEVDIIEIFKVLGDETRMRIFHIVSKEKLCVCEIENILKITQSNASRHLTKLRMNNLILSEKSAQWVYYGVNHEMLKVFPFIQAILETELKKIKICQQDIEVLQQYRQSGMNCEQLKGNGLNNECKGE